MSESVATGEEEDEVEDLRIKSRARTVAAARHAFRKVHMVLVRACDHRLTRTAYRGFGGS